MEDKLYWYKAKFLRAVDGDTIEIDWDHGAKIHRIAHIRVKDIDAPEMFSVKKESEEYKRGLVVKQRVEELLGEKYVGDYIMIHTQKDKKTFDRYVADVYYLVDDNGLYLGQWASLADTLLKEGLVVKV